MTDREHWAAYLSALEEPFLKLARPARRFPGLLHRQHPQKPPRRGLYSGGGADCQPPEQPVQAGRRYPVQPGRTMPGAGGVLSETEHGAAEVRDGADQPDIPPGGEQPGDHPKNGQSRLPRGAAFADRLLPVYRADRGHAAQLYLGERLSPGHGGARAGRMKGEKSCLL